MARPVALGHLRSRNSAVSAQPGRARCRLRRDHGGALDVERAARAARHTMSGHWDVVVAGGGIHGVGIAQAVAAAGHSVLVLEQQAIAAGSSSRSSKLIHGGLRYLESGQFRLVRESLRERALLLRLAPELVRLQKFFIPIYDHSRRRPWQLRVGLSLYALLAGLDQRGALRNRTAQRMGAARRARHRRPATGFSLSRRANRRRIANRSGHALSAVAGRRTGNAGAVQWRNAYGR